MKSINAKLPHYAPGELVRISDRFPAVDLQGRTGIIGKNWWSPVADTAVGNPHPGWVCEVELHRPHGDERYVSVWERHLEPVIEEKPCPNSR